MKQLTITTRQIVLSILAIFVMFLPRNLSIAGIFSFRVFILAAALFALLTTQMNIRLTGMVSMPMFWLYLGAILTVQMLHGQYTVLLGTLIDILVLYLVLNACLQSKKEMDFFVRLFLVVLIIYCVFCLLETTTGFNFWRLIGVNVKSHNRFGLYRACGAYTTSINNGTFLLLTFPLIWYSQKYLHSKSLSNVALFSVWIALFCTMSRGAILFAVILYIIIVWKAGIVRLVKRYFPVIFLAVLLFAAVTVFMPSVRSAINNFFSMFAAVFDSSVADDITREFGSNAEGIGQRFDLYSWVWEESEGHRWLGAGANVPLNHLWRPDAYGVVVKQSIENFYLATFFHYGFLGSVGLVLFFIQVLIWMFNNYKRERHVYKLKKSGESLQFRILITFLCYFGTLFTVSAVDDFRMFIILLAFSEAYNRIYVKTSVGNIKNIFPYASHADLSDKRRI